MQDHRVIPIYRAVIPVVGIYYYTDKDVVKVNKKLQHIIREIGASRAPTRLITRLVAHVLEYPYILDANKEFAVLFKKKVGELLAVVMPYQAIEKYKELHDVLVRVSAIL